jgi:hypothetical protein
LEALNATSVDEWKQQDFAITNALNSKAECKHQQGPSSVTRQLAEGETRHEKEKKGEGKVLGCQNQTISF